MLYVKRMGNPVDTIQILETFARIAEAGSLSAAARSLGVSQASVSRQLAALEARLGLTLARRSTHELTLTPEGRTLLPRAREVLASWEATKEALSGDEAAPSGLLRVIAPSGFGPLVVAPMAASFVRRHPAVDVDLTFTDANVDLVGLGADLQLKVGAAERQELIVRRIGAVRRWLVAARDLDLSAFLGKDGSLRPGLPVVALAPLYDSRITLTDDRGRKVSLSCRVRVRSEVLHAAYQAVLAGAGAGLLPLWLIKPDVEAGRLIRLLPDAEVAPIPIHLVFPPGRYRPSRTRLFAELIEREMRDVIRPD